ncbi:MAG: hypothetical protein Q9210_002637 [Variospora velana]
MLSLKLLPAVFLAGFAVAQNTTSSSGSGSSSDNTVFDVSEVNLSQRGLLHSCLQACELYADFSGQWDGVINSSPIVPNCVAGMLQILPISKRVCAEYVLKAKFPRDKQMRGNCTCKNGTAPALAAYADTYASNECQARFAACRNQNPGSQTCIECGTLRADDVPASTSSASTAAATSSTGSAESAAPATTSGPPSSGGNVLMGAEMGVKGAVGLLAAMGLML